ncbi:sigma factor-like helix-turn-helix DNA-binding protein [Streptomyces sp. NPDC048639]|uniref:sigma factor-like helix-turn-helix DNA-binding protein n=1 Tax=Streptomyces sp. NPDC048639 TaxID=3365581 RepID=UPI003720FD29
MHRYAQPGRAGAAAGAPLAFDALYTAHAAGLVRQAYLLTGSKHLARQAVYHAFYQAWHRWPEVAVDSDPAGWVRAAAYEYALSPWRRLHRANRGPSGRLGPDRALITALIGLPPSYRRALLLHDGVGLGLPETAAETEASTAATTNRLMHARAAMAESLPELREASPVRRAAALRRMLSETAAAQHVRTRPAESVRAAGERRAQVWTRTVYGLVGFFAAAVLVAAVLDTLW